MINTFVRDFIGFILILFIFVGAECLAGTIETTYTMDAEIVAISGEVVTVKDSMDEIWEFYGEGFRVGDNVRVRFFNNGTDSTRLDDVIENVKNV